MKRGETLYCRECGCGYPYRGGRQNPLCPQCYQKAMKKRKQEEQKKLRSTRIKGGAQRKGGPLLRHAQEKQRQAAKAMHMKRLPMEKPEGSRKLTRATMEALMKDPVGRLVHEIEVDNEERRKQGLPPLSYGQHVAKYGK